MSQSTNGKREMLERNANIARERILDAIDALERKRHLVTDARARAGNIRKKWGLPIGAAFGVGCLALATLAFMAQRRRMHALKRSPRYWLARAVQPPKPSFVAETVKRVLSATLITVASEVARGATRV
jgi:hypothetical protein